MSDEKCKHCIGDMHEEYKYKYPEASHCMFCGRYIGKNDYHASQKPEIIEKDDILSDKEERHPAYAQLTIHRQSGGYNNLYGSAIKHQDTICLEIHKSAKYTSEWSERYFAAGIPLISVRMSQAQFAQAITSMNMGSGVPITLEAVRGKVMPKCQEVTVSERANDDLRSNLNKFADKIARGQARVNEILAKKGSILKGERQEIKNVYDRLMQDLRSNMPFLHTCMTEAYDKTATSAKADIEAFYDNAIRRMGLEAIENQSKDIDTIEWDNKGEENE